MGYKQVLVCDSCKGESDTKGVSLSVSRRKPSKDGYGINTKEAYVVLCPRCEAFWTRCADQLIDALKKLKEGDLRLGGKGDERLDNRGPELLEALSQLMITDKTEPLLLVEGTDDGH